MKISLLNPAKCCICRYNACYNELPLCTDCLNKFQRMLTEKCPKCGNEAVECTCIKDIYTLFIFKEYSTKLFMYFIKYFTEKRVMAFLGEVLIKGCGLNIKDFDGVTYVPRLPRRKRRYGYDQSKELAKSVSEAFGIPLIHTLKRKGGPEQKLLSRGERMKNAKDRYRVLIAPEKKFKRLLLIDDITTTGATLRVCKSLLLEHTAKAVTMVAIATTPKSIG